LDEDCVEVLSLLWEAGRHQGDPTNLLALWVYSLLAQRSSRAGSRLPLHWLFGSGTGSPKHNLHVVIRGTGRMWSAAAAIRCARLKMLKFLHGKVAKALLPTTRPQLN